MQRALQRRRPTGVYAYMSMHMLLHACVSLRACACVCVSVHVHVHVCVCVRVRVCVEHALYLTTPTPYRCAFCCCNVVTLLLHYCCVVVTLLGHCCGTVVTLLWHSCDTYMSAYVRMHATFLFLRLFYDYSGQIWTKFRTRAHMDTYT
jgi:hypothetical protein